MQFYLCFRCATRNYMCTIRVKENVVDFFFFSLSLTVDMQKEDYRKKLIKIFAFFSKTRRVFTGQFDRYF